MADGRELILMSADKPTPPDRDNGLPRHVAIIMDGNGRWAKQRLLPRVAGHRAGVEAVRQVVRACAEKGIEALTLFAFSSENWRRPAKEVSLLMELFLTALQRETQRLNSNNVRLRVIGDRTAFPPRLKEEIASTNSDLFIVDRPAMSRRRAKSSRCFLLALASTPSADCPVGRSPPLSARSSDGPFSSLGSQ